MEKKQTRYRGLRIFYLTRRKCDEKWEGNFLKDSGSLRIIYKNEPLQNIKKTSWMENFKESDQIVKKWSGGD